METATLSSQEWTTEKQHLAETLQIVVNERQKLENDLGIVDGNDRLIQVLDDGSTDAAVQQFIIKNKLRSLHQLRLSSRQPYFARLDFTPDPGAPVLGHLKAGKKAPSIWAVGACWKRLLIRCVWRTGAARWPTCTIPGRSGGSATKRPTARSRAG